MQKDLVKCVRETSKTNVEVLVETENNNTIIHVILYVYLITDYMRHLAHVYNSHIKFEQADKELAKVELSISAVV